MRASFALTNKTRYQCSSHHEGGDGACSVGLSVPRDRAQRIILGFTAAELPKFLTEIEARYEAPGEIAQGVLRELFPRGIWLEPDHNGGRFLWAMARLHGRRTALTCTTMTEPRGQTPSRRSIVDAAMRK